ncbi:MAG: hypothetical protein ACKVQC_10860 [Elusimicrobiota bacterium]
MDKENRRGSLRVNTYLPLWFQILTEEEKKIIRSQIADYSVQRHVVDHENENELPEDGDLKLVFQKINRFQKNVRYYLEQIQVAEKHPYQTQAITLSSNGCVFLDETSAALLKEGQSVALHLRLPTHPSDIFVLGNVIKPATLSFEVLAPDQEDWIIEYLIHRQQEDIRLGNIG